jgi:hypothetical protein
VPRPSLAPSLLALVLAGCGAKVAVDHPDTSTGGGGAGGTGAGGSSSSSTSSGTGGGPVDCHFDSDCMTPGACVFVACVDGKCVTTGELPEGAPCDDGLFCTTMDACFGGVCQGIAKVACPSAGPCSVGTCDESQKGCVQAPANDGLSCGPPDACIVGSFCQGGACVGGQPQDCSFLNGPCAVGKCLPGGGCTAVPVGDGQPCEDGLFCTSGDFCKNGVCFGGEVSPCPPGDPCHAVLCSEPTLSCTLVAGNDGAPCDDGNACTQGDACQAGVCVGKPGNPNGPVLFSDDFHDGSKGWTLGPEWQIGPALVSTGGTFGSDPGQDHSPSADNGIAGVVLGGNASTNLHAPSYLTSPAFDTSVAPGGVILTFYRWLLADYDPFMHSTIDVWNGVAWINLWKTEGQPTQDAAWTFESYDLTPYKGSATRIRFGFDVTQPGVFQVGSWNLDDVAVSSSTCP